ncbi:ABC transporter permease [Aureibacillus halotolerans]|uniref:Peptide/nickel transport system permease protein n=1 Tax=Aureibacillus halotolerans TaxID=1508390 RepID=A0A4R6TTV5_9BACI|nr:ABC transporter permease [Aureibacillus halotolerans]TDQ36546.1 peptide/nickel transport system permease protein [Aureibacillus halotolerans]
MLQYTVRRVLDLLPTLFVVAVIVFLVTRLIPGDPASVMLGPQATVEDIEQMRITLGLDQPILQQFISYIGDLLTGNLGTSIYYKEPVTALILERFPNTIVLSVCALFIALIVGIPAGIISATRQRSWLDYSVMVVSLLGVSMPVFWLGVMLVLFFSVQLGWFPSTGMGSMEDGLWSYVSHLILPSVTLATIPMATFARITRSAMLEVVSQDYIKTARAKGLKERYVIGKHAFKNALTPLLTVMGMQISLMLGGAVLTETIFSWPGMGRLVVDAIDKRDFMVVQGTVMFIAIIFVVINLIVDLLYKVVNPKVNYSSRKGGE